ncbi:UBP-type zinc finger domain-containing protein [Dactylosporangium sp. NPDC049140]|uniref:ubiquitin carboxyl-terminal hydrolase 14 n=1 Tax=Dactylosporangium sp. NPDC049140 TaxID=3155647 RepID=UPI0033D5DE09
MRYCSPYCRRRSRATARETAGSSSTVKIAGLAMRSIQPRVWPRDECGAGYGGAMQSGCAHVDLVEPVEPSADGCEDCLAVGGRWVHLRLCLTCGHVGCCDSSPSKHATAHFRSAGHPLVQSFEPGEEWVWCYADEALVGVAGLPSRSHS